MVVKKPSIADHKIPEEIIGQIGQVVRGFGNAIDCTSGVDLCDVMLLADGRHLWASDAMIERVVKH